MTTGTTPPTIVLIGLRGSGKSTLGRRLGETLGRPFVDLDDRTAAALGSATPGEALRTHGVDRFRLAEASALRDALGGPASVLALGGGTPTAPGAGDTLAQHAREGTISIVYLRAEPATLGERLSAPGAPERPALVGSDPVSEIATLFAQRDPLYRQLAGTVLHLDGVGEDAAFAMLRAWAR